MAFWHKKQVDERTATSSLATPEQWLFDSLGGSMPTSGQRVTVAKAFGLIPVYSAVSIISEQISMLPLKVYKSIDGENKEAIDSRGWRLLHDKPNEHTPAGRFWATVAVHLLLWGNAFLWKRRNSAFEVEELTLLKPDNVAVFYNQQTGDKRFRYIPPTGGASLGRSLDFTTDDLLHIFSLSLDGIVGESVISHCKNGLGAVLAREAFEGAFYGRGANLRGILETPDQLGDNARRNLKDSFADLYAGADKAFGTPVLEEGVTWKPVSSPLRDLEFVAQKQLTRTDIAVMFKLPPNTLGGSTGDSLTYSTVELNQQHIALHAVAPITETIAQFLTHDPSILPQRSFSCAFLLDAMMRADSKTRSEVYEKALDPIKGWMGRPDVRQRENLYPADDSNSLVPTPEQIIAAKAAAGSAIPPKTTPAATTPPASPNGTNGGAAG